MTERKKQRLSEYVYILMKKGKKLERNGTQSGGSNLTTVCLTNKIIPPSKL